VSDGPEPILERAERPPPAQQRRRVLVPTVVTLAVLLFLGAVFTGVWTDRLWFKSVGYSSVFTTMLSTRIVMFILFGLVFAAVVTANVVVAYRSRPMTMAQLGANDSVARYRQGIDPLRRPIVIVIALLTFVFAGSTAAGRWRTYLMWQNGTDFNRADLYFGKDIGFYVFDYPWFRFLLSFGFTLVFLSAVAVALVHYLYGGIAFQGRGRGVARGAQVHLSILIGIFMLLKAVGYYLDRYGFVVESGTLFDGIGYTDANARIPSKNILMVIAVICALLFLANVVWRSLLLPAISLGLLALTALLIGGIWPAVMQSFQVKPSEPDKEGPYIAKNIEATRDAYDVSDVEVQDYTAKTDLTQGELKESAESRVSARLLDPTLVSPAFEQLQQVRGFYTVPTTLDVDRYDIDGQGRQDVVVAARELNLDGLPTSQRNWANDHTVFTHGYGMIAARGNQANTQGEPVFVQQDIPASVNDLDIKTAPRIYFGENSPEYSIVGAPEGASPIEVDVPRGGEGTTTDPGADAVGGEEGAPAPTDDAAAEETATQNTYDGEGGVPVGGLFNKVLYAAKFGETNILLSNRVNSESKILYDRGPRQRVEKVAPWLTVDGDPYPAVVDGRVVWIVDGYTTSNSYPYAERTSLDEATSDTLTEPGGAQVRLPSDEVNYMRNSVKAVVDAYDGSVDLFEWDETDPILQTWMKAFPGAVQPKAEISEELLAHLRYPVDMFKVQRDVLSAYHVTDPQAFYEGSEKWKVPEDPAGAGTTLQPPYYLSISRPGEDQPEFSLTSVYLPNNRQNLASFVSVNSEATNTENYGKLQILELGSTTQVAGPSQIANQFQSDTGVADALLGFKQQGTDIEYGNLLTLPVGDGLLYAQPVYIRRTATEGSYPQLQFVIASFGDNVGFGATLDEALQVALNLEGDPPPTTSPGGDPPPTEPPDPGDTDPPPGGTQTVPDLLNQAQTAYEEAQQALEDGDLATYQDKVDEMNDLIDDARRQLENPPSDAGGSGG